MTADDFNELELEFERTIAMLNRGEKSGKMRKEVYDSEDGGWWNPDADSDGKKGKKRSKRKFEKAYESAYYTAGESEGRGGRGGRGKGHGDGERAGAIVFTAIISVLVTSLIFTIFICCRKRRTRDQLAHVNELSQTPNQQPNAANRNSTLQVMAPVPSHDVSSPDTR